MASIAEEELPEELTFDQAVETAYSGDLVEVAADLRRGLPALIECEKELAPFLFVDLRRRLRQDDIRCMYLDGRVGPPDAGTPAGPTQGIVGGMLQQLRDAVRGVVEKRVVVLPHLDLLTTSQGGLTAEAREVIPLLYENPELVWLGFKDPSFPIPKVIENLFPKRYSILGVPRTRLRHLITRGEARKFGRGLDPWNLYKYVSGMNAVRLRKLLSTLDGEDYPESPRGVLRQIRAATTTGTLEVPDIDLDRDLGGYAKVKKRLRVEILDVLSQKDRTKDEKTVERLESLIPRGMIFWGPPGTGKTLFAKAMATAIGAAITVVSGPELKSKWVGESEENLRRIFHDARRSAPAIIVFDELDSFATRRGAYEGAGVEHSMVNQLLTEMDGFHKEELVFVVGTTNFVEAIDPALLRPGRFEFHLHIPVPDRKDRREILAIYDRKMNLKMSEQTLEYAVRRTSEFVEGQATGTRYTGDHLNALCRAIARIRLRSGRDDATTPADVDQALTEWADLPRLTKSEQRVVATHESGHAVVSLFCEHAPAIERISIRGDVAGALGFVQHKDPANKYVLTRGNLIDRIRILLGGREAERLLLDDLSIGSEDDLRRATEIARYLIEHLGMGGEEVGIATFGREDDRPGRRNELSEQQRERLDQAVQNLLTEGRQAAQDILTDHRALLETLRDLLLDKKVLDSAALRDVVHAYDPSVTLPSDDEAGDAPETATSATE